MASTGELSKQARSALVSEQQVDAVKRIYARSIDLKSFPSKFPSLSHLKKQLFACAESIAVGLHEEKLHREICKRLKLPVPEGCYTVSEMREALLGYHFRVVDHLTIATFTDLHGPSKTTLHRQHGRLVVALKAAGVSIVPEAGDRGKALEKLREKVRAVIGTMSFDKCGRKTLLLPGTRRSGAVESLNSMHCCPRT
jgi:hypothetical protein